MQLSRLQSLLSYFVPVRVLTTQSPQHNRLELYRFRGRWQLATEDAFYSDGAAYSPLRKAFRVLQKEVANWQDVLVLGAGIGSAVMVLDKKHRSRPRMTLVDLDEEILTLAGELLAADGHADHVELICEHAGTYVVHEERTFDAVVVDIFRGREVPSFALTADFLARCIERLRPGGWLVMNFIINHDAEWTHFRKTLEQAMPGHKTIAHGINRILLWQQFPEKS